MVRATETQSNLDIRGRRYTTGDRTMTIENILSQMGAGTKQLTERFSENTSPMHDQHLYFAYEPSPPSHGHPEAVSKHGGGGHKSNAAMSALTLLAFLFFLHILQQCIKDHMAAMSGPQIMIMAASRQGENVVKKSDTRKLDKSGLPDTATQESKNNEKSNDKNKIIADTNGNLMRINTAEPPKIGGKKLKSNFKSNGNRSLAFTGFVSATDYE